MIINIFLGILDPQKRLKTSNLTNNIFKPINNTFKTIIELILLHDSETWTLTRQQEKRLDGTYTRLLMRVKNPPGKISQLFKISRISFKAMFHNNYFF